MVRGGAGASSKHATFRQARDDFQADRGQSQKPQREVLEISYSSRPGGSSAEELSDAPGAREIRLRQTHRANDTIPSLQCNVGRPTVLRFDLEMTLGGARVSSTHATFRQANVDVPAILASARDDFHADRGQSQQPQKEVLNISHSNRSGAIRGRTFRAYCPVNQRRPKRATRFGCRYACRGRSGFRRLNLPRPAPPVRYKTLHNTGGSSPCRCCALSTF